MAKRCRRNNRKPWDGCEDVVHYEDGGWFGKIRVSDEVTKGIIKGLEPLGLSLPKDEKGYYGAVGELVCTAD